MSLAAQKFFYSVLTHGDAKSYLKLGDIGHLFLGDTAKAQHQFIDSFVREYGQLPTVETMQQATKAMLSTGPEPAAFYVSVLRKAYVDHALRTAAQEASTFLVGENKDPLKAFEIMAKMVTDVRFSQIAHQMIDYREAETALLTAYAEQQSTSGQGLDLGWPYLNELCGSIQDGDVISVVGQSGLGKTFMLLWMALHVWLQGRTVLFASMEVKRVPVLQRLTAMHTKKSLNAVKGLVPMTSKAMADWKLQLNALPGHDAGFYVIDGDLTATVADIEALALILKPGLIVVDGAYLCQHPTEKDRYRKVAENADLIKRKLANIAPTVASYQFSREVKKLKKGEKGGLDEIAGSAAVGHNSSLVLGLFEAESVETEVRREVTVVKGRNGETGSFFVRWLFSHVTTDFSEIKDESLEDLAY